MHRTLIAMICAFCGAILLADESGKETGLLKARIAQLESQLVQTEASRTVCMAQLNQAQAPQIKQAIDKEAGCTVDMSVVPPKCKE